MTSDRKIAANRKNAQKSTGPQSASGRRRSSANALRHGLAVAIASDPSYKGDVSPLALAIERSRGGKISGEHANRFAEAEIQLSRIQKVRASLLNKSLGNSDPPQEAYAKLNEDLEPLDRYERRARSQRKRALKAMTG